MLNFQKTFSKKTVVRLADAGSFSPIEITAKNFKPIEVRCAYNNERLGGNARF